MSKAAEIFKKELRELLPTWIFFFFSMLIVLVYRSLLLAEYGISVTRFYQAAIFAAVAAKVFLIVDVIPLVNRFQHKPLLYRIIWKTAIYFLGALVIQYAEALLEALRHASFSDAQTIIAHRMESPRFWAIQLWLATLIPVYITLRELVHSLGRDELRSLFLGKPHKPQDPPPEGVNH